MKKYSYPAILKPIVSGLATNYTDVTNNDGVGGVESRTYIDGLGRPIQTRTQGENGNYRVVSTAYDERGERLFDHLANFWKLNQFQQTRLRPDGLLDWI